MSNTIFVVIVVGIVLAMLVMLVKYAKFIHRYPSEVERDRAEKSENEADDDDKTGQNG